MDSKKRIMFSVEDDYYYITLKIFAILKSLNCDVKPLLDYRKLSILTEIIKDSTNIQLIENTARGTPISLVQREKIVNISCNSKMNLPIIKRVLFFLEKQNLISMNKNPSKGTIDVSLLKSDQLAFMIKDNILSEDIENLNRLLKAIPRIRTLKISTMCEKMQISKEVSFWLD